MLECPSLALPSSPSSYMGYNRPNHPQQTSSTSQTSAYVKDTRPRQKHHCRSPRNWSLGHDVCAMPFILAWVSFGLHTHIFYLIAPACVCFEILKRHVRHINCGLRSGEDGLSMSIPHHWPYSGGCCGYRLANNGLGSAWAASGLPSQHGSSTAATRHKSRPMKLPTPRWSCGRRGDSFY
jgi:hypothetical protein